MNDNPKSLAQSASVKVSQQEGKVLYDIRARDVGKGFFLALKKQDNYADQATIDDDVLELMEAFITSQRRLKKDVARGYLDAHDILGEEDFTESSPAPTMRADRLSNPRQYNNFPLSQP